jgi:Apea-like HEPN
VDNSKGIYAGLAGVTLDADERSLGHGIILRRTYAHVMAPFLMAFSPASPGKPHPAPWSAVKGGFGFDMWVELEIPPSSVSGLSHAPDFVAWWITALLRLRVGPTFIVPIVGEQSFATAKTDHSQATYYPVEMESRRLVLSSDARSEIAELDVAWLEKFWMSAADLFSGNGAFQLLFEATDQCMFSRHRELALLSLWSGLEAIFSPDKVELKYRISSSLASFLEPAGVPRMNAQKAIAKLYDSRSAAAHGREDKRKDSLQETYGLARRAVLRIIEDNRVPTHVELEAKLFGADPL